MAKLKFNNDMYSGPAYSNKLVVGLLSKENIVRLYCSHCGSYDNRALDTVDTEDKCRYCNK